MQSGNKVHIGPEAFSEGNIQETMQELANYGAFGNDNKPRTKTLPSDNENAGQRIVKDVSADGRASTSVSAADREMIMDLETILSLSEKVSQSCRGEEAASGLYDISSHNEDDVLLESKPTEKKKVMPEYQMKTFPDSTGKVEVRISMPKVTAVSEVSLSVIGKVLCVSSETYDLKVSGVRLHSSLCSVVFHFISPPPPPADAFPNFSADLPKNDYRCHWKPSTLETICAQKQSGSKKRRHSK